MEGNQVTKTLQLLSWVIVFLLLMTWIPKFSMGSFHFRNINLLSDLEPDAPKTIVVKDSLKRKPDEPKPKVNSCPAGMVCIEDFSQDKTALNIFLGSLRETRRRPIRVAFFGDSFIEGDILCSSFRDTLQHLYGGRGVGFVPITSEVTAFRTTIQHAYKGWRTFSLVGDKNPFSPPGFSGYCFVPQEGNELEYKPGRKHYAPFGDIRVFYRSTLASSLQVTKDDSLQQVVPLQVSDTLHQEILDGKGAQQIKMHFEPVDSLKVYGVSFEESTGLYVDNFAMRGNSGIGLYQIDPRTIQEFNQMRHYRLILLQYGLNVVSETDDRGYGWYIDKMVRVIQRLRQNLPESNFLLLSVSDRCYNQGGKFVTIPNILLMRDAQREIARQSGIAFWDLLSAMNGDDSMIKLVNATPPMASKDYTHLNFSGGRRLSKKLADALLYEKKNYDSLRHTKH